VAVAVWDGGADEVPGLYPREAEAIRNAVPARQAEFARGRACARRALAQLGSDPCPIPVGDHRQPLWPPGYVGSITHCKGLVVAVAARDDRLTAIGVDAEPAGPLPDGTAKLVLAPDEMEEAPPPLDTVVFSAKEAVHKALFPISHVWMDFLDVRLGLDAGAGTFHAASSPHARTSVAQMEGLHGRFSVSDAFVLTAAYGHPPL